ncbi:Enolase-phosphatase E1 [Nowakowskiella sp. JEL0078]|nr:Enolase-phosphatase E1 [Nowakowskiella sp. JEL0078]
MKGFTPTYNTVVLDIEGTTTPIVFVKEVLFPYVSNNMQSFLVENWSQPKLQENIELLREQSKVDAKNNLPGVVIIPEKAGSTAEVLRKAVIDNVLWQMSSDRKIGPLKSFQVFY